MNNTHKSKEMIRKNINEIKGTMNLLSDNNTVSEEVINSLPGIFYMFNKKGRFIKWNKNFELVTEHTHDEVAKSSPLDFFTGETKKRIAAKILSVFTKGEATVEGELVTKSGKRIPHYFTGKRVKINKETHLLGVGMNISERVRAEKLQAIVYEISKAATNINNLIELYELIHNTLKDVLDVTNFYIAYYDRKNQTLSFPFFKDEQDVAPKTAQPFGNGITEYVIKTDQPLLLSNIETEEYERKGKFQSSGPPSEQWMGVPLKIDKKVIGAIAVNSYTDPALYKQSDLKILIFVAQQIALAIKHVQSISQREKEEQLNSVVYEISKAAHNTKDLDELYKTIHIHLNEILDTTNLFFAIISEDETEMSFPYYVDEEDLPPDPIKLPQNLISEYVINTKKSLFLKRQDMIDLANKDLIDLDVSGTISEVWMGAPLISKGKAIGIIVLQSYHDPNLYSESDLGILTFVSEQIAQTIEYRQAITDLQVEKTYLDELFTSSPEALALVTVDSTILHINKQFTTLFGYEEEGVFGKNIDDLLVPSEHRKMAEKHTQDVASGMQLDFETVREKKDGTIINVSVLGSPVNYKGDVLAVYVIYRDITDRIKADEKLKKSKEEYRTQSEELAESNSLKEMLLDVIAHDLRNPAGVIKGFAEFGLEMDPENEILSEIDGGVNNLLDVIHNATTLSKVALGDVINKEELDLMDIINNVVKENLSQFEFAEMTLDMKIEEKLIINANPIISEVFRNYISNAIKYAKPGKKVIIDTMLDNGYITVNFKDFGETINKKDRDNIFMRNVQLGKTKGRGLGLAIVRRIAEAHNAEVGVKPNKPTGNIFYIKIPIQ